MKIIYRQDEPDEPIQFSQHRIEGEWMSFYDGSGLVLQIRANQIERIERVS